MYMRRLLAVLCALCCILSSPFSAAYAVEAPNLDDLGIDPWGDLGIIQDTPQPAPSSELIQDPPQMDDEAGEGGSLFSLIPEGNMYLTSYSGNFISYSGYQPHLTLNANSYKIPSQIGSGNEEMFGSSNLFYGVNNNSNVQVNLNFKLADLSLTSSFDVPEGASSLSLKGSLQFLYSAAKGSTAPVTISSVPSRTAYQACSISVAGAVYNGVWNEQSQSFDFDISEIDISSFSGSSVDFVIRFSQSQGYSGWTFSYAGFSGASGYGAIRFMFVDGVNAAFTFPETPGGGFDEESKGLLRTIVDTIKGVLTAIVELPGKIVSGILDGLKALFVPTEQDLQGLKSKYEALLSERLGFIWQAGEWITGFGSEILSAVTSGAEAEFVFPGVGFDMNGEHYQLIEKQTVDFGSNGIVEVIQPFTGTVVAFIVVIACVNLFHDMVAALISGKSYFDFLKGGGEE